MNEKRVTSVSFRFVPLPFLVIASAIDMFSFYFLYCSSFRLLHPVISHTHKHTLTNHTYTDSCSIFPSLVRV